MCKNTSKFHAVIDCQTYNLKKFKKHTFSKMSKSIKNYCFMEIPFNITVVFPNVISQMLSTTLL